MFTCIVNTSVWWRLTRVTSESTATGTLEAFVGRNTHVTSTWTAFTCILCCNSTLYKLNYATYIER